MALRLEDIPLELVEDAADASAAPPAGRFTLLSVADLYALPEPSWLIDDLLPAGGLVSVIAPYANGKTFWTLDASLHVAANRPLHGRAVAHGAVVYVLGEGRGGLAKRVRAWEQQHDIAADTLPIYFLTEPMSLLAGADPPALLTAIRTRVPEGLPIALINIDTLTRAAPGGNLNDPGDMARAVVGADSLRHTTGATVALVHHTGWEGERSRGAMVLPDSVDTEIRLTKEARTLTVSCGKQRDDVEFTEFSLLLREVGDSLVLTSAESTTADPIDAKAFTCLRCLDEISGTRRVRRREWERVCQAHGITRGTFDRRYAKLLKGRLVEEDKTGWQVTPGGRLTLASQGGQS
jgi:hypothetical protein